MTKTPISLQDLRRSLYVKAKAESAWRFWGLYVHVCKRETLQEAYLMAKSNDGAPGMDGVTFESIEESGRESFLKQIQNALVDKTYQPKRVRKKEIPKDGEARSAFFRFPQFVTVWSRVRSSSSWSLSLKLILNRGPTDTGRRRQLRRRCFEWTKRSWKGRPTSLILICEPTLTMFSMICCLRRWLDVCRTRW